MESDEDEKYCANCKRSVAANNFAIHSAFCERNIFVCKICHEPVGISEKDEHFDNYHVISPCNLCEASIEKWMIPDHMKICPKRLIVCEYCEAEFPLNEYTNHVEFCGSRTEKCLLCKKYIMMKDKAKHTELHRCEQKFNRKKIEEEIKQNEVNEVISCLENSNVKKTNFKDCLRREETGEDDPHTRVGANFEEIKESASNKTSYDSERREQDLRRQSPRGVTALPDRAKQQSSYRGECHICKQSIPWVDMNTHIPSCASLAGKCSLCGEDVPNHAMKDHMKGHYSSNSQLQSMRVPESPVSYTRKNSEHGQNNAAKITPHLNKNIDGMKSSSVNEYQCPSCLENVPRKDRHRHEKECQTVEDNTESTYFSSRVSQSFEECPLCFEKISEENRETHFNFDCKTLLENNGPSDTSNMRSDSSNMYECPLCLALMRENEKKKHELFECQILIDNSGVQIPEPELDTNSTKKTCHCSCRKKTNNCWKCKSNSQSNMSENQKYCQQRRLPCSHCKEMVDFSIHNEHEMYCPASKSNKYSSKHETKDVRNSKVSSHKPKGAIPKKTNIREMMMPTVGQCKYCKTTLNMDILKYHEDECVHRPVDCPECQRSIPIKDLEHHECRKKKKKDMKQNENQQVPEEKTEPGFVKSVWNFLKPSSNKEKDEKESTKRLDSYSFNSQNYPYYRPISDTEESHQPLYFSDTNFMVPCEFCNKEVAASDLVLHETGCKPDLVSYAKQEPSASPNMDKSSAKYDSMSSNTKYDKYNLEGKKQPFFPENSLSTSDRVKRERKTNSKPGEFLQIKYEKSSNGKKEEYNSFQSVWNSDSYSDDRTEDPSDHISKPLEDPMDIDKLDEPDTTIARTMKHGSEIIRQTSEEMISEDGDMSAYLSFLSDDRNNKLDKKHEIQPEVNEKRAEVISPNYASYSAFDSNLLKENFLQKNREDCSDKENKNFEGEPSRSFKENLKSVPHFHNSSLEMKAAIQHLKDSQLYASSATTHKEIPIKIKAFEKKDEELEVSSKQKLLLDCSIKSNKIDDFKKYLPDLQFASRKEKSFSADDENNDLCAKDSDRCGRLIEKHINKTPAYDRLSSKEECAESLKNLRNLKFGMAYSSESCFEKNVCNEYETLTKESYKNISTCANYSEESGDDFKNFSPDLKFPTHEKSDIIQKYNRLLSKNNEEKSDEDQVNYITDVSKHIWTAKDDNNFASNSCNLTDLESAPLKSERCSSNNTDHKAFLQKNVVDEPVMPSVERIARNAASENECISNYKKYFPDFKFAPSEKSTSSNKDSLHHSVPTKKNLKGSSEKLHEQQHLKISKHSDCSENERESANSFNSLVGFKYANLKSAPCNEETYIHGKKDDDPSKLRPDKTSTDVDKLSENETECLDDFKQYLPDFKFGSQTARSSKDKTCFANLSEKNDQLEEKAFKLQSEKMMKKIEEHETRIANIRQAREAIETENRAKWNKWRETLNLGSSDSE